MYRIVIFSGQEPVFEHNGNNVQITDDPPTLEKTLKSLKTAIDYVRDFIEERGRRG